MPPNSDAQSRLLDRVGTTALTQLEREAFVRLIETHDDWYTQIAMALQAAPTATITRGKRPDQVIVTMDRPDIDPGAGNPVVRVEREVTVMRPARGHTLGIEDVICSCPWEKCSCGVLAVTKLTQFAPELISV